MSDNQPNNESPAGPEFPVTPPTSPEFSAPEAPAFPPAAPPAPGVPVSGAPIPGAPLPGVPVSGAPQAAPGAPYAGAAPAYPVGGSDFNGGAGYVGAPTAKKGLAITGMILGIAGLLMSLLPFVGGAIGFVGALLGVFALVKKQPKGLAITGIVTGAIAFIIGIVVAITFFVAMSLLAQGGGDLVAMGQEIIDQCESGAETVEVMGETVLCSDMNY